MEQNRLIRCRKEAAKSKQKTPSSCVPPPPPPPTSSENSIERGRSFFLSFFLLALLGSFSVALLLPALTDRKWESLTYSSIARAPLIPGC